MMAETKESKRFDEVLFLVLLNMGRYDTAARIAWGVKLKIPNYSDIYKALSLMMKSLDSELIT